MAYVSTGDKVSARATLEKALALNPNFDGAQQARTALVSLK
jgi:Tfp pilus assembly protein PilF